MSKLSTPEIGLLESVIERRKPCLMYLVHAARAGHLSPEEREALREVLADEFLTELKPDYEPTERGVRLDDLIGALTKVSPLQERSIDEAEVRRILDCKDVS